MCDWSLGTHKSMHSIWSLNGCDTNIFNQRLQVANQQGTRQIYIPQGYHYGSYYNTFNIIPNPEYEGTQNFNLQMGQQLPRNLHSNADELVLRVTEMMKSSLV
jgi:hypothetical protein